MTARFRDSNYNIGQNVKLYEKVRDALDKRAGAAHEARVNVGNKIVEITPNWDNENINPGTATGAVMAGLASIVDELYVPISADTEVAEVERVDGGVRYLVNVDSGFEQQARFRAMMEAGSGYTSLITDDFDLSDADVLTKRPGRDTWQFEVVVKDENQDIVDKKDQIGLGIFNR